MHGALKSAPPSAARDAPDAPMARLRRIGFLTLPNYSMIALSNALEACRMANYVSGGAAYSWQVLTVDGAACPASNGLSLSPTVRLAEAGPLDLLIVCGGIDVRQAVARGTRDALRRAARKGVALGALCTGTFALAEAGLLNGYRCAIHWENLAAIREEFPDVAFQEDAFVIDRDRLTCTGGVAPLEMMLVMIAAALGPRTAGAVADQFIVRRTGAPEGRKAHLSPEVAARQPALAKAVELMARHVEKPMSVADVAAAVALSQRQLERLFRHHLSQSPAVFYLGLRLNRARELLRLSPLPVTDVAFACGFQSAAHFSVAYGRRYGHSPKAERAA
ncbi:GlxA family transcriptional regulator [Xanthobacter sp. VTT E-85241]|uniref:GlxA family transcriptional regulator n=1 Tax=Roseixanthobacter finlandensis TaxID=3119922 RepID=UPI00372C91FE